MNNDQETSNPKPAIGWQTPRQMTRTGWTLTGDTSDETILTEVRRDYLARHPDLEIAFTRDANFNFYFWTKPKA